MERIREDKVDRRVAVSDTARRGEFIVGIGTEELSAWVKYKRPNALRYSRAVLCLVLRSGQVDRLEPIASAITLLKLLL